MVSIRFRVFRQMLLGLIIIVSLTSIILSSCLSPHFVHRKVFWMIILVQSGCLIRSLWSGIRKPLLKQYQSVASENIGLFILLPFELILVLVTLTLPLVREPVGKSMPAALEALIVVNTTINIGYTTCLLIVAMLTAPAYDVDVWIRDIDSSPSPFPVPILLSFVFPCVSRWKLSLPAQETEEDNYDVSLPPCLPGCNCSCTTKPTPPTVPSGGSQLTVPSAPPSTQIPNLAGSGTSLPHQPLVRIPDAAERRASIIVVFDV